MSACLEKIENLENRIKELSRKKLDAQKACHIETAKPPLPPITQCEEIIDSLDWTAEQWKKEDLVIEDGFKLGYKDAGQLAEATYKKEISLRNVDIEKYTNAMKFSGVAPSYESMAAPEDIDAVAQGLREASERRQKRRKVADGGLYMNERNRQFNLKLNREYGEDKH